jgi:hypothetical protein
MATDAHKRLTYLLGEEDLVDHVEVRMPTGAAADEILRCAREERAAMIVIGSRERAAIGALARSFVSPTIISSAPCPVVIVREGAAHWLEEPLRAGARQSDPLRESGRPTATYEIHPHPRGDFDPCALSAQ